MVGQRYAMQSHYLNLLHDFIVNERATHSQSATTTAQKTNSGFTFRSWKEHIKLKTMKTQDEKKLK